MPFERSKADENTVSKLPTFVLHMHFQSQIDLAFDCLFLNTFQTYCKREKAKELIGRNTRSVISCFQLVFKSELVISFLGILLTYENRVPSSSSQGI